MQCVELCLEPDSSKPNIKNKRDTIKEIWRLSWYLTLLWRNYCVLSLRGEKRNLRLLEYICIYFHIKYSFSLLWNNLGRERRGRIHQQQDWPYTDNYQSWVMSTWVFIILFYFHVCLVSFIIKKYIFKTMAVLVSGNLDLHL